MRGRVMRLRGTSALALSVALVLSGCTGDGEEVPAPPIGVSSPDSSASASADPWAIPDPITEDYLIRVLNELEREVAEFQRWVIQSEIGEDPPANVLAVIERTFNSEAGASFVEASLGVRDSGFDYSETLDPRGQYFATSVEILRSDPTCPLLLVEWDSSEVTNDPSSRADEIVGLDPAPDLDSESGWVFSFIRFAARTSQDEIDAELEARGLC